MAVVYLAEDLKHRRKVAVKVLRPEIAASIGADRFLREIEIVSKMQHPHVLPLYDSGAAGGLLFYVMPYVEGESLKARIARERQLQVQDALYIARQVASALAYAHGQGVIHRDIKPENVLLSGGEAVVADFGIARAISVAAGQELTETGFSIGTPAYMSPEQAGGGEVDGRSDVYSLGCVIYEMLAGEPPFTGPTVESIVHQHMAAEPPSLSDLRAGVGVPVANVVGRALAKTPADRYQTAAAFADDLELAAAQVRVSSSGVRSMFGSEPVANAAREPAPHRSRSAVLRYGGAALAIVAAVILVVVLARGFGGGGAENAVRLTVLPFMNLGPPDDEYFAAGITDEITARLAGVAGLSIIARQSAVQYKHSDKTPQQIGDELGVEYVLAATVSWQNGGAGPSRVRVRAQLIRTADASHVWAGVYDDELTEVFAVQASIAVKVVEALGLALLEPVLASLEERPTDNLEAYDYYLQGKDYASRPVSDENLRTAARMFGRALELDPRFALAAARLSRADMLMYWYYFDRSAERLSLARAALDTARILAPESPEVHLALGDFYYYGRLDYERALQEYAAAGARRPGDSEILMQMGLVERRRGNWPEAARMIARAAVLEPRSATSAIQAAMTYFLTEQYDEAERHLVRARSFAPDELRPHVWMALLSVTRDGDTAQARTHLEAAERANPAELDAQAWWHWALYRMLDGASARSIERLRQFDTDPAFFHIAAAQLYGLMGRRERARVHYDSARVLLRPRVERQPEQARFHSELGLAYAGLGMSDEALREGRRAVELLPVAKDPLEGANWVRNLAEIYMMLDMPGQAVEQLESLMSVQSWASAYWLRLDPLWSRLRDQPRFNRLVAEAK
jgi:serine/threonine-protein kinase